MKRVTKCENADAPASFTSDVWKHHGFPALRSERGEKVTELQKNNMHILLVCYLWKHIAGQPNK